MRVKGLRCACSSPEVSPGLCVLRRDQVRAARCRVSRHSARSVLARECWSWSTTSCWGRQALACPGCLESQVRLSTPARAVLGPLRTRRRGILDQHRVSQARICRRLRARRIRKARGHRCTPRSRAGGTCSGLARSEPSRGAAQRETISATTLPCRRVHRPSTRYLAGPLPLEALARIRMWVG